MIIINCLLEHFIKVLSPFSKVHDILRVLCMHVNERERERIPLECESNRAGGRGVIKSLCVCICKTSALVKVSPC